MIAALPLNEIWGLNEYRYSKLFNLVGYDLLYYFVESMRFST